jgi:hypothetical protein
MWLSCILNLTSSQVSRAEEATLTIGQVAAAVGVHASAVRYYERRGVMPNVAAECRCASLDVCDLFAEDDLRSPGRPVLVAPPTAHPEA